MLKFLFAYRLLEFYALLLAALSFSFMSTGISSPNWAVTTFTAKDNRDTPRYTTYPATYGLFQFCQNSVAPILCASFRDGKLDSGRLCFKHGTMYGVTKCPPPGWIRATRAFAVMPIIITVVTLFQMVINATHPTGGSITSASVLAGISAVFGLIATIIFGAEYKDYPFATTYDDSNKQIISGPLSITAEFYFFLGGWIMEAAACILCAVAKAKKTKIDKGWVELKATTARANENDLGDTVPLEQDEDAYDPFVN